MKIYTLLHVEYCISLRDSAQIENHEPVIRSVREKFIYES